MLADVIVRAAPWGSVRAVEFRGAEKLPDWVTPEQEEIVSLIRQRQGTFRQGKTRYLFDCLEFSEDEILLLFKRDDRVVEILKKALECLEEGIQIYTDDAALVYMNSISKRLSGFEKWTSPLEGKKLMELYHVTPESSTVMTTMRNRRPVINRYAKFEAVSGKNMLTCNTGYPLYDDEGELLGAVSFEQDIRVLHKKRERQEKIALAMEQQITSGLYAKDPSAYTFEDFIGKNPKVLETVRLAQSVSAKESSVLLLGETGTGKEIFAQSIHHESLRSQKKFVAINCAAVPEQLVESILFGTEKGAFTGSLEKKGLFEEADGGTIFLDELNSMSLVMQSKLLRVLQENAFRRVGGSREIRANVRVIASCNEDVFYLISENKLRKDLFYRVATMMIQLPPLREHIDDLEVLIWHRVHSSGLQCAPSFSRIDPEALWILEQYSWPGNVRELYHVVDYAMTVSDDEVMRKEHLPDYILNAVYGPKSVGQREQLEPPQLPAPVLSGSLRSMLRTYEDQLIQQALTQTRGNISQAAELLGIQRQNLQYRLRRGKKQDGQS